MQLFRTEMLFFHPQPTALRARYGCSRGAATRYGHARMRPSEMPSMATPDPERDLERAA